MAIRCLVAAACILVSIQSSDAFTATYTHSDPLTGQPGDEASVSTRRRFGKDDGTILLWFDVKPEWGASRSRRFIFAHDTGKGIPVTDTPPFLFANMFALGFSPGILPTLSVWMSDSSGQAVELGIEADLAPGWHHLAVVWCRERRLLRLSVDGREVRSNCPHWLEKIDRRITIGNWTSPAPEHAAGGRISRFRIYKVVLEPEEIEADYRHGMSEFRPAAAITADSTAVEEASEPIQPPAPGERAPMPPITDGSFTWYVHRDGEPFRVKMPAGWTVERDDPNFVASFISPGKSDFPSEMNIMREDVRSLSLFVSENDIKAWANSLGKKYTAEVRTSSATIAGYPAVGFELTATVWGRKYKVLQAVFHRRRRSRYVLQGMFLMDDAAEGIEAFRILMQSFQFRDP